MEGLAAPPPEHALLAGITALAAEGEALAAQTASRFDASVVRYQVVWNCSSVRG